MIEDLRLSVEHGKPWAGPIAAFLAEKQRRSGSTRTADSYAGLLRQFFGVSAKTPDQVNGQDVFSWAYATGPSGRVPTTNTIGARIAALSSFYRFLIRMDLVRANPCDALDRPRAVIPAPRGLSATEVQRLLSVIPETPPGLRDKAIILTLVLTGRRRAEVLGMKAGDLNHETGKVFYSYRGKGGKTGRRELPGPAYEAICRSLAAWGKALDTMAPQESLWPGKQTDGISSGTFYAHLQRYLRRAELPPAGVHIFRHTAAKLRRDAGASLEEVSHFLDHSNLAVTSVYLQRLEGQEDLTWAKVAGALGL